MQYFLVGGAVRDQLLNKPIKDRDWVVVGAKPEQMLEKGFKQVGKDFPVFLHPDTKEEYALARTEIKSGQGYQGFHCEFSPDVTLEQDLLRRDLTINAMAMTESGVIIDPYGGLDDIKARRLRHVSAAFVEDPLRVLRVARFLARYHHDGFEVADETTKLLTDISASGELAHLTVERIWQELERALTEPTPWMFFHCLNDCAALTRLFPELIANFENKTSHTKNTVSRLNFLTLKAMCQISNESLLRFAALCNELPCDNAKDVSNAWCEGDDAIKQFCRRLKAPRAYLELAALAREQLAFCLGKPRLSPKNILLFFQRCDAIRKPERFSQLLVVVQTALATQQEPSKVEPPELKQLESLLSAIRAIDLSELTAQGLRGEEIKTAIENKRLSLIEKLLVAK